MINYLPKRNELNKGQAVLAILLVMTVILVIGLSVASRSVTDIKISQQSQESARALWVAQGGLEQAMKGNVSIGVGSSEQQLNGVKYFVTKTDIGGSQEIVLGPASADNPVTLWLIGHDSSGQFSAVGKYSGSNLRFFWGENTGPVSQTSPALEVTLIYKNNTSGVYYSERYVYDVPGVSRTQPTNFAVASTTCPAVSGKTFDFCTPVITLPSSATNTLYLVRLKLLFNTGSAQPIGVLGDQALPSQGSCFESTATIEESGVSRKLRQCQSFKTTPSIFDYVLFSGGNIE